MELALGQISSMGYDEEILACASHLNFLDYMWQRPKEPFIVGMHTKVICEAIDKAFSDYRNGKSTYMLVKVPFRHGKTSIGPQYLPPHFLGEFQGEEILIASYTASLVNSFSRFARQVMRDSKYQMLYPGVKLSSENQSVESWDVIGSEKQDGHVHWLGIGGSATGKGGNLILVDDTFKGREEAESVTMRDKIWDSLTNDILTRAAPVAIVIIIGTPWHVDDHFGRISKKMDEDPNFPRFVELKFPAFSDSYPTGTLFPERFSVQWYNHQKATLGPYAAAGLLQCEPTIRGGNAFQVEKIDWCESIPEGLVYSRGWDLASTEEERVAEDPDYTVGAKVGIRWIGKEDPLPDIWLTDVRVGRWDAPERDAIIKKTTRDDGRSVTPGIEIHGQYKDTQRSINHALGGLIRVEPIRLPGDKLTKAGVLESAISDGRFHIVKTLKNTVIDQLSQFPSVKHDDIVDAIVIGIETHRPYIKRVIPGYDMSMYKPLELYKGDKEWSRLNVGDVLIFISMELYDQNMYISSYIWGLKSKKLWLYNEIEVKSPSPESVSGAIRWVIPCPLRSENETTLTVTSICGDDTLVAKGLDWHKLLKRQGVSIKKNKKMDLLGSIARINQLISTKKLTVGTWCIETDRQLRRWFVENEEPEMDKPYAFNLCRIASELVEIGEIGERNQVEIRPYNPIKIAMKEKIKNQIYTASKKRNEYDYLL
jgi:phage terminase large subunit-like protein